VSRSRPLREFFVDRSLGRLAVPAGLRVGGWDIRTLADVYGADEETVADVAWLELCGRRGWVVLAKDKRIRYRPAEIDAIRRFGVRAFVLTSGNLTSAQQVERFLANGERIARACAEDGPFLYAVHATRIEKMYPPRGAS